MLHPRIILGTSNCFDSKYSRLGRLILNLQL